MIKADKNTGGYWNEQSILPNDKKAISIEQLLIWAYRDQQVYLFNGIDETHGHGQARLTVGNQVSLLSKLGVRVDCDNGSSSADYHVDAIMVWEAVNLLPSKDSILVTEAAMYAKQPTIPNIKLIPIDGGKSGERVGFDCDAVRLGVTRYHEWCDKKHKIVQRRITHKVCRVAPELSTKEMRDYIEDRSIWLNALNNLSAYLIDLTQHSIIVDDASLTNLGKIPSHDLDKINKYYDNNLKKI